MSRRKRLSPYDEARHWITEEEDKPGFEKRYISDDIGNKFTGHFMCQVVHAVIHASWLNKRLCNL